ncbi:MAG: hypothetical protein E3J87_06295 [Candidatus Cloacimonadota bacterium]|nr:MAG: hypothetical protein E3J87_06295 [Candidatus Cloacimonadota bacterium]
MKKNLSLVQSHNWVTFLLAKLYLRKDDRHYAYLLYSYLRMLDDFVDEKNRSEEEKINFISRQRRAIKTLYKNCKIDSNGLIVRIIEYDCGHRCKLESFIFCMLQIFQFDTKRKNRVVSLKELKHYSINLGNAYTQLLLYFVEPKYKYQEEDSLLAHACHQAHMLRDFNIDQKLGYINISKEEIAQYNIRLNQTPDENFQKWLKDKIEIIKDYFKKGKTKVNKNPIFRIKIIGHLYCFRYETVLRQIEDDGYQLKDKYSMRLQDKVRLILLLISVLIKHLWQKIKI